MPEADPSTLEEARDFFEANPSQASAETYARMAAAYHGDGMISDETLDVIVHQIRSKLVA